MTLSPPSLVGAAGGPHGAAAGGAGGDPRSAQAGGACHCQRMDVIFLLDLMEKQRG